MPLRATAYIVFVFIVGCWGAVDDIQSGKPIVGAIGFCVTGVVTWFACSYWKPFLLTLGVLPSSVLLGLSAVIDSFQTISESADPELSMAASIVIALVVFAIMAPAYYFGGMAIWRKRNEVG